MTFKIGALLALTLIPLGLRSAGASGLAQPEISFEKSAVVATGLSPGGPVVWFAVERRVDPDYSADIVPRYRVTQAEVDGTARLDLERDVELRSIWVVVDQNEGAYAVASPEGYRVGRLDTSRTSLEARGEAEPDAILDSRPFLLGLAVRPGAGAWTFGGGDGGPSDEDQENNGRLSFALSGLQALPGSPEAPAKVAGSDLWFVIDPLRMQISTLKGGVDQ